MRCLSVQAAVTVVTPHTVVFQNVQHPGHLAEDQHTRTFNQGEMRLDYTQTDIKLTVKWARLKKSVSDVEPFILLRASEALRSEF